MSGTTMPELISNLSRRVIRDEARIDGLETELGITRLDLVEQTRRAEQAEAEARGWADSFKQAEAALDSFLGPDGGKTVIELRSALAERDRMLEDISAGMVRLRQDAALTGNEARYDGIVASSRVVTDARAEEG